MAERDHDLVIIGFSGAVAGYETLAYFNAPSQVGVILLKNSLGDNFNGRAIISNSIPQLVAARGPHPIKCLSSSDIWSYFPVTAGFTGWT
jgi:hypothetical protein